MKKILVAGAGHGGLICATLLSQKKYDVTVIEKRAEKDLGFPWHDDVMIEVFHDFGIDIDSIPWHRKENLLFRPPNLACELELVVPDEEREIAIDRKDLYKLFIGEAKKNGVKFLFEEEVLEPIFNDQKITGLKTNKGTYNADMVIDASGIQSNLRSVFGEHKHLFDKKKGRALYAYRAYYNWIGEVPKEQPFFIAYFMFNGLNGLSWFRSKEGIADILIGSIEPLTQEQIDGALAKLKSLHPELGDEIKAGGFTVKIPITHPPSRMVMDNFAIVGDTPFMTIPVLGSGIELAMRAGKILADTIVGIDELRTTEGSNIGAGYPVKYLYEKYQVPYFLKHGAENASVDYLKCYLFGSDTKDIDFLFKKRLILAKDMKKAVAGGGDITLGIFDLITRLFRGISRLGLLVSLKLKIDYMKLVKRRGKKIPTKYNEQKISKWANKYNAIFDKMEKKIL